MKYMLTIESDDAEEIREAAEKLTGRVADAGTVINNVTAEKTAKVEDVKSDVDADVVDSDGMPYNAEVHATTREVNKDGTWKAQRGKGDQAKAARAAFKAEGGDIDAPKTEAPGLPGTGTKAPGLPGAENIPAADPVTYADFVAKATAVMESGKIDSDGICALYCEVTGDTDVSVAAGKFETNESLRVEAVKRMTEIENG